MTKILKTVCETIEVVLSTIFLPVRILIAIVVGLIEFPIAIFASKFNVGVKEYFATYFNGLAIGLKIWRDRVAEFYAKD